MKRTTALLIATLLWSTAPTAAFEEDTSLSTKNAGAKNSGTEDTSPTLKLYALNCGGMRLGDISAFNASGAWNGQSAELAVPCFLIRHKDGDLLWDTGLDEALADVPGGIKEAWGETYMQRSLTSQLAELGLAPDDIDYLALSHHHSDHSGNANLFAGSTVILQKTERAAMFSPVNWAVPAISDPYKKLKYANTITFEDTHDVFGDGSVIIHKAAGHTLGHAILQINLQEAGPVLLSGDLYILERSRTEKAVPSFNLDKEATIQSIAMFEALATNLGAQVVIQHDPTHFKALPAFPAFLD